MQGIVLIGQFNRSVTVRPWVDVVQRFQRQRCFGKNPGWICLYCDKIFIICVVHDPSARSWWSRVVYSNLSAYYIRVILYACDCTIFNIPVLNHYIVHNQYLLHSLLLKPNGWVCVVRWRNVIVIFWELWLKIYWATNWWRYDSRCFATLSTLNGTTKNGSKLGKHCFGYPASLWKALRPRKSQNSKT